MSISHCCFHSLHVFILDRFYNVFFNLYFQITESRSLSNPFIGDRDSDSDIDLVSVSKSKVPPISLSKFGGIWRSGSESDKADDPLYDTTLPHTTQQKTHTNFHNNITPLPLHPTTPDEISAHLKNGGKSCHPKMRAKFMFRTGDFETCDWGYDWSSSDNESLNKGCVGGHATVINGTSAQSTEAEHNPLKRKRSDSISELSSICSETTIPAVDDLGSPVAATIPDWSTCPILKNNNEEKILFDTYPDSMPILANVIETPLETAEKTDTTYSSKISDDDAIKFTSVSARDDVYVTEITCDEITVIFQESQRPKGFFKWQD